MFLVLLFMLAGVFAGFLLRKWKFRFINGIILTLIWLLLFLLGVEVGMNEQVVKNFSIIGFDAFIITIGGTVGTVLCAWFVYERFFKRKGKKR